MTNGDKIRTLFKVRDKAVKDKDYTLFLSTQLEELTNSVTSGYMGNDKLVSNVVAISYDDEKSHFNQLLW